MTAKHTAQIKLSVSAIAVLLVALSSSCGVEAPVEETHEELQRRQRRSQVPSLTPYCGNRVVEGPESCDDGNNIDDDYCNNSCSRAGSLSIVAGKVIGLPLSGHAEQNNINAPLTGSFSSAGVQLQRVDKGCGIKLKGSMWTVGGPFENPFLLAAQCVEDFRHGCLIHPDQTLHCWGSGGGHLAPPGAFKQVAVDSINNLSCGVRPNGTLTCWGQTTGINLPFGSFDKVSIGGYRRVCGLSGGSILCNGGTPPSGTNWVDVSVGPHHICGINSDHVLVCTGDTPLYEPGYIDLVSMGVYMCALSEQGSMQCWDLRPGA